MGQDQLPVTVVMKKHGKHLVVEMGSMDFARQAVFIDSLEEGQKVEVTYEVSISNGSYAQLSKIHKCIREMAKESGVTFEEMKLMIKQKAGLHLKDGQFKSFADCSRDDLSGVIQTILEVSEFLGMNMNQY